MPQVQVGFARIVAAVDAQGPAGLPGFEQPLAQLGSHGLFQVIVAVFGALHEEVYLVFEVVPEDLGGLVFRISPVCEDILFVYGFRSVVHHLTPG
jgi:hypothetical protein